MFWCDTKNRWCSVWSCRRQQCEFTAKEGEKVNHKKIQEMRGFAKDIRAMADVTEKYADVLENPNSTDREKEEAHKRYLEALAILDI